MLPEAVLILSPFISFHSTVFSFSLSQGRRTDLPAHSEVIVIRPVDGTLEIHVLGSNGVQKNEVHTDRQTDKHRQTKKTANMLCCCQCVSVSVHSFLVATFHLPSLLVPSFPLRLEIVGPINISRA